MIIIVFFYNNNYYYCCGCWCYYYHYYYYYYYHYYYYHYCCNFVGHRVISVNVSTLSFKVFHQISSILMIKCFTDFQYDSTNMLQHFSISIQPSESQVDL